MFSVGEPPRVFNTADSHGLCLAVHFVAHPDSATESRFIEEYTAKIQTLAGIRQIFVTNLSADDFKKAISSLRGGETLPLYRDVDGTLAKELAVSSMKSPTTVVLDVTGNEIFRSEQPGEGKVPAFGSFSAKFHELTKGKDTTEGNLDSGLALQGFDPVAYLDENTSVAGDKSIQSSFHGVTYRFSTSAHRDTFNQNPAKYLPAYGGWCATAMAKGDKVEVDPRNFKVTGGRLFLFYKGLWGNALTDWTKDEPNLTSKADAFWQKRVADK